MLLILKKKRKSTFAPSMPQVREEWDLQVCGFHTCWLMRNVRQAQVYAKQQNSYSLQEIEDYM